MKLVHRDDRAGKFKVRPETLDDLWHLHNLIEPGDLATMSTYRAPEEIQDKLRPEKQKKQRITLTLKVEQVEFHEFSDRLRILGTITEGPRDLGMHHTFNVEAAQFEDITVQKARGVKAHHWQRIKEAEAAAKRPLVLIVAMDDDEAVLAALRQYGVQTLATVRSGGRGKQYESVDPREAYFSELLEAVARARDAGQPLVVVGPGFTREEFLEHAKARAPEAVKGALTEGIGHSGMVGVQETLKRGIIERIQQDQQVAADTRMVEQIMARIASGGLVAYGRDEVRRALDAGAVETLVLTDEVLRGPDGEALMDKAQGVGAKGHIVAVAHEAGAKLKALGGTAALLRYAVTPST